MVNKKRSKAKQQALRKARKQKRRSQREQKSSESHSEFDPDFDDAFAFEFGVGRGPFELVEYDIVLDPMPDPYWDKFTPQEADDLDWVGPRLQEEPARCIEILEPLIEKHPDFPKLYNYLSVAYAETGRTEEALGLQDETYRRFPKYLFARINQAVRCLQQQRSDEVPQIFDHKFALHMLYPERRGKFHLSEFVQFSAVMAIYFSQIENDEVAERYLEMAEELDPEHPLVRLASDIVHPRTLLHAIKGIMSLGKRSRRRRSHD